MNLCDLVNIARWDSYEQYHCAARRRAFVNDVRKSLPGFKWSARPSIRNLAVVVCLETPGVKRLAMTSPEDMADCVSGLMLEALRDVAAETKKRLDR